MNCVAQCELYDYGYPGTRLKIYLHRLGSKLILELQRYGERDGHEIEGCLVDLGEARPKVEWSSEHPAAKGESGLYLPAVNPGDSIILDTPGASSVKAVKAGDRVYREIEKKSVQVLEKQCTCPIFDLIAGGCTCGGFKSEKEKRVAPK